MSLNSCQVLYSHLPICFHQSTDPLGFFLNTNIFLHFVFSDQTSLLEFLHILTTNHKLVFAPVNNEPDFIAGLCHWLLVMGTHKSLSAGDNNKKPEGDSLILLPTRRPTPEGRPSSWQIIEPYVSTEEKSHLSVRDFF